MDQSLRTCFIVQSTQDAEKEQEKDRGKNAFDSSSDEENIIADMSSYGQFNVEFAENQVEFTVLPLDGKMPKQGTLGSLAHSIRTLEATVNHHRQFISRKKTKKRAVIEKGKPGARVTVPTTAIRAQKVNVYLRVVFLKLGEIDTLKENFAADAFIQARWHEPSLDHRLDLVQDEHTKIKWSDYWNPKIYVENNLGEPKETVWSTLMFNSKGEAIVYERRRIKGTFLENLELNEFPFDTQDLTLTITSERSEAEMELEEDNSEISSINVQSFVDEQEWQLHSHVDSWKRVTTRIYQNSKYKHPALSTSCRASRRPGFFMWNIFLVMLFICSLTFTTFTVKLTLPQNRLQLTFILLLTTITFKFVVSQTIPKISYLTYLDKYILTSMGILCTICVWHAIAPTTSPNADKWALIIFGSLYAGFHIFFFLYIFFVAIRKRWMFKQKDKEHKDRELKLEKQREQYTSALGGAGHPYITDTYSKPT